MWDGNTRNKGWVSFAGLLVLFRQKTRRANNEHQLVLSTSTAVLDSRGIPYSVRPQKTMSRKKLAHPPMPLHTSPYTPSQIPVLV